MQIEEPTDSEGNGNSRQGMREGWESHEGLVARSRELLPAGGCGKGLHQGWLCFEGGYSFKMRVPLPEDGWEQERGLGKVTPEQGVRESRGRHKNAAGGVQKHKIT